MSERLFGAKIRRREDARILTVDEGDARRQPGVVHVMGPAAATPDPHGAYLPRSGRSVSRLWTDQAMLAKSGAAGGG